MNTGNMSERIPAERQNKAVDSTLNVFKNSNGAAVKERFGRICSTEIIY